MVVCWLLSLLAVYGGKERRSDVGVGDSAGCTVGRENHSQASLRVPKRSGPGGPAKGLVG